MMKKFNMYFTNLLCLGILLAAVIWPGFTMGAAEPETPQSGQNELALFETAYKYHMKGQFDKAIHFYQLSIEKKPTAQAHTFLGWALSHQGKYDEAISECLKAIGLDPDYGNPYNDIGAYYIEMGMFDKAIPFLKKAIKAKNYENYQFPHFNLGRVYVVKGIYAKAIVEFKKALEIDPNYLPAKIYLEFLYQSMKII
jgi:tetratricopeptide (TPR) repeat protein